MNDSYRPECIRHGPDDYYASVIWSIYVAWTALKAAEIRLSVYIAHKKIEQQGFWERFLWLLGNSPRSWREWGYSLALWLARFILFGVLSLGLLELLRRRGDGPHSQPYDEHPYPYDEVLHPLYKM